MSKYQNIKVGDLIHIDPLHLGYSANLSAALVDGPKRVVTINSTGSAVGVTVTYTDSGGTLRAGQTWHVRDECYTIATEETSEP